MNGHQAERHEKAAAARAAREAARYRELNPDAARWAEGCGPIRHEIDTQVRIFRLAEELDASAPGGDGVPVFELLHAADRVACAAMHLVVHMTYARNVYRDGRELSRDDFKPDPEGHTGGALNMVPAYVGYLAANALSGLTRAWIMGQGHCVAAIDSVNLLVGNTTEAHASRYDLSDEGLTRYVRDFYSYRLDERGRQESPLGSHVNVHTAGGLSEGGYLGFTELQYVHMPLPKERLVVFLSDGAFEEQRGSDWAPRWWRAADSGIVTPFMINNGRRIDQRTTMSQQGGTHWFLRHLELNGFDPFVLDGRDPAAFAWAILEMEARLAAQVEGMEEPSKDYPLPLPYGIATAPKGAGFYGEGTNLAHNLPLPGNPHTDDMSAQRFNESAARLHVAPESLERAIAAFTRHDTSGRPREKDNPLVVRNVLPVKVPEAPVREPGPRDDPAGWKLHSPMRSVDETFLRILEANPDLRVRVGNPDEMRSNRMQGTLERLKFRVTDPEEEVPEDVHGSVVTALNEEAVASAALANKGGLNLIVTYEAFGTKMHGEVRQEIIFADHCQEAGREQGWLSVPLLLTSHTWENGKNELSHQDPSMCETMLGEPGPTSRVLFPPDSTSAAVTLAGCYETRGQVWSMVVPKRDVPDLLSGEEASRLLDEGALRLDPDGGSPEVLLTAVGAYQLEAVLRARGRLADRGVETSVVCMLEPGRFRLPRSERERAHGASPEVFERLWPEEVLARIFVTHTRPEVLLGVLQPLHTGRRHTSALGFIGRGGTLDVEGMLFVNGSSWAHILQECARVTGRDRNELLEPREIAALDGEASPEGNVVHLAGGPPPAW